MAYQPKILVAGFGTWPKAANNPAEQVAKKLGHRDWAGARVITNTMPVDTQGLSEAVEALLTEHRPDAWVGIGVSGAAIVQAEMVGVNWRDFDVPDATGAQMRHSPVLANGPAAYNATLPNEDMVEAINAAGIPAAVSFHAGTHLCNQMLYTAEHLIAQHGLNTLSGFIHIPQSPANLVGGGRKLAHRGSMDVEMSADAVAICIETIVAQVAARSPVPLV